MPIIHQWPILYKQYIEMCEKAVEIQEAMIFVNHVNKHLQKIISS